MLTQENQNHYQTSATQTSMMLFSPTAESAGLSQRQTTKDAPLSNGMTKSGGAARGTKKQNFIRRHGSFGKTNAAELPQGTFYPADRIDLQTFYKRTMAQS